MDKTKMVCVRLTDDELSYIDSKALSLGLGRSRYIAFCCLGIKEIKFISKKRGGD